ncbi:hypothetical protein [Porphyromonas sp.]|uniref:hypothetical protein n=1 Tax=Porphyromonas sp. TaxID=1924944 RepID=UPI0026DCA00B|nr:hypothetical protein [Porphyromonas sp.]MDO4695564.1 hypothetical protein [Porphyromonas sp.]
MKGWMSGWLLLILFVSACARPRVYAEYKPIDPNGWDMTDEIFYSFYIEDTTRAYEMTASLRYSPDFTPKVLPLGLVVEDPKRQFRTQVLQWHLERSELLSTKNGYNIFQSTYKIDSLWHFPNKGLYTISLRHLSQDSVLTGLVELGLIVESRD